MTGEPRDLGQVDLRVDPQLVPFDPPPPNTVTTWDGRDVLWLGPDEWLIVGDAGSAPAIVAELRRALGDRVGVGVAHLVGRDQLGQKAHRHQLCAEQQRAQRVNHGRPLMQGRDFPAGHRLAQHPIDRQRRQPDKADDE